MSDYKVLRPHYVFEFPTTALRLAYTFDSSDRGAPVFDYETGLMYFVMEAGAGATAMAPMASLEFGNVNFQLDEFVEVDANGDVGAGAANGGKLASDTTPILRGDAAESAEVVWAASNNDIIAITGMSLPSDFDDTRDCYVDLTVASGGTTDAASFTVETGWDGGTLVSDTATGTAATADQQITATIAAADVPASAVRLTLMLTPTAHTTDTKILKRARLRYFRK